MPLGYDPNEKEDTGGPAKPGTYAFTVASAEEVTFRSNNEGLKVQLDVDTGGEQPRTVYENFVYVPKALWRLEGFLKGLGFDFESPPDAEELIGCPGVAYFKLGAPNDQGRQYLEADEFKAPGSKPLGAEKSGPGNMAPGKAKAPAGAAAKSGSDAPPEEMDGDDIPF